MADFDLAYNYVLPNELGHDNDPDDPGGETMDGITLDFLRDVGIDVDGDGDIDIADIRALTPEKERACYRVRWDRWGLDRIKSQELATKVFDLAINTGFTQCVLFVQRALCAVGLPVDVDGKAGPQTLGAFGTMDGNVLMRFGFLAAIRSEAGGFYRLLVFKNPKWKKYLAGWTTRAYK